MNLDLMMELISHGSGFLSNLAPLLHENSKLWPHQKSIYQISPEDKFLPAHELLAQATPGIPLNSGHSVTDSSSQKSCSTAVIGKDSEKIVSLETVGRLLTGSIVSPCLEVVDARPIREMELRCYLLAWHVAELRPGSYFYCSAEAKLILVRNLVGGSSYDRIAMDPSLLQRSAGLIVVCGLVRYDGQDGGERDYRDLLLGAGSLANNLLRNAKSLGLVAGVVSQFLDDPLALELGVDPTFEQPLTVITFGSGTPPWKRGSNGRA